MSDSILDDTTIEVETSWRQEGRKVSWTNGTNHGYYSTKDWNLIGGVCSMMSETLDSKYLPKEYST